MHTVQEMVRQGPNSVDLSHSIHGHTTLAVQVPSSMPTHAVLCRELELLPAKRLRVHQVRRYDPSSVRLLARIVCCHATAIMLHMFLFLLYASPKPYIIQVCYDTWGVPSGFST